MASVAEPFPVSYIGGRYLIFDVDTIAHARREHNICGVFIGTIPNLSQQNVFLGIPLELMAEEARVLVEGGHAYIVDDVTLHKKGFLEMSREDRMKYLRDMDQQGMEVARGMKQAAEDRTEKALKEKGLDRILQERKLKKLEQTTVESEAGAGSLFDSAPSTPTVASSPAPETILEPHYITPTTSHPPLPVPDPASALSLPEVPRQYPLFRYLHSKGYFSMPGIRFGCHYSVYPGDPLRFHSHFLAAGLDWDEEFDLLDLVVGGGRLGTGVKKAYLIGGEAPSKIGSVEDKQASAGERVESVRAFSMEWAGF
ncbi:SEN34 subunit of tRNA-splicing endonuclease [Amniculicola lignicola CBS 123094]|uniref:tRNA-splicing endonuclease subunit Sen34 n=1 Tax=Amniculicola lignicola CBS 123094 TaxID=1392246 RepID=A0A6A5VWN2_9PLEO|nr:SEN34 subunit of tRNA-splicing endonuclease [Amniculicola lignicola CBS 123094]